MLSDKTLTCVECGSDFTFTVGEQEFFASRGFTNEPSRCPQCRAARRSQQGRRPESLSTSEFEHVPWPADAISAFPSLS